MKPLIAAHLTYLAEVRHAAPRTVAERATILVHADRDLPAGVDHASEAELGHWLHSHGWSAWTIHTYDTALRVCYTWAVAYGHLTIDPMARIRKPPAGPRVPRPWSDEEAATILGRAPAQPWRRAGFLAVYAGLRCSEIAAATSTDIVRGRLRVRGKGGRIRIVPVCDLLAAQLHGARGPLVVGAHGRALTGRTLSQEQRHAWRDLGLAETVHLHGGRHLFATALFEAGADVRTIQTLMGHSSLATTEGYLKVADHRATAAVSLLPQMRQPEPAPIRLGLQRAA